MHQLDQTDYLALRENCKVIEQDGFGDKVMILQDGTFLKLFRRKRLGPMRSALLITRKSSKNWASLVQRLSRCTASPVLSVMACIIIRYLAPPCVTYTVVTPSTLTICANVF